MKTPTPTPRWQVLACGMLLGMFAAAPAVAVHDGGTAVFELDGDATDGVAAGVDWDSVFGIPTPYTTPRATPSADGAGEVFIVDIGNSETGYAGSNKDIHEINTWQWKPQKVVPDKDNITNAYAYVKQNGDTFIYFGLDRFATNGDAALGFWFFQNPVAAVAPPSANANGTFSGTHAIGDVLVQVDYRQSNKDQQRATEIEVFEWVGSGGSHGPLNLVVAAQLVGTGIVCTAGDTACATTNFAAVASPWAYTPKSGTANVFPAEAFYEGGINITALFGDRCFASFLANSRSSHSETADLKDFALGDFNTCGSIAVTKACATDLSGNPSLIENGTKVRTVFDVEITNDGLGSPIHDIQLREDATAQSKENCKIIAVDGGAPLDIALPQGAWVDVPGGPLAGGATRFVTVQCDHSAIALRNAVSARASQTSGGARSLVDSFEMAAGDVCPATLNPDVLVQKSCTGVTLNTNLTPRVCVNVYVENTGDTRLFFDSIIDDKIGPLTPNKASLDPGESDSINACYNPTSADVGGTDPGNTRFIDEVVVSLSDSFGNSTGGEASADCPLCPACPACP
ncbi:MAG: hypothetical protein ACK4RW_06225 [Rehaibacterium terrae]|uniref:hypothetical protein n=1 Tax=Rehaibacterium terrae TaxID=1341696 RepID=UPI00391C0AC3